MDPERIAHMANLQRKMLVSHAYRELWATEAYRPVLEMAPLPEDRAHVQQVLVEEMQHYERCLRVDWEYAHARDYYISGHVRMDIVPGVVERMVKGPDGIPPPGSWIEFLLAQALNDYAGLLVLRNVARTARSPPYCPLWAYAGAAEGMVADEEGHGEHGRSLLLREWRWNPPPDKEKEFILLRQVDGAIRCIGRPGTDGDRAAVEYGLKARGAGEVLNEFTEYADWLLGRLYEPAAPPLRVKERARELAQA
ncbi:MAG: hypothetical protein HY369_05295 [Candidatus Aenigmarchaeota archaeon]|nr:hypothetical protein [Candidatus Aenigmarchaeota archaeon]